MQIFGVVNASPDSLAGFSVASGYDEAAELGARLLARGADHLDVGAQASHGDAALVTPDEEWEILEAPLAALVDLGVDVSVDTWQPETARRAFAAGARVLNAAEALQDPEMVELAAQLDCLVVLPFMLGPDPRHLRHVDGDPVEVMVRWFDEQLTRLEPFGLVDRLLLDPGTGFAPAHWDWADRYRYQKAIYLGLGRLRAFGRPLYVPIAWKQTPDRMELVDIVLDSEPEYIRSHIPSQVRARWSRLQLDRAAGRR